VVLHYLQTTLGTVQTSMYMYTLDRPQGNGGHTSPHSLGWDGNSAFEARILSNRLSLTRHSWLRQTARVAQAAQL
jgi:hypothetical protein